jgi:23S rRNA (adenine2030-N6)-methyltransferase
MLVLNPPFVLKAELETLLPWLEEQLAEGPGSHFSLQVSV